MKKIILLVIFTILLGTTYILPQNIPGLIFLQVITVIVNTIFPTPGLLLLIYLSTEIRKDKKLIFPVLVCWIYQFGLFFLEYSNLYIREATEVFNVDRGDILPHLPLEHRMVGFFIRSLLYLLPLIIYILYQGNIEDENRKLGLGSDN